MTTSTSLVPSPGRWLPLGATVTDTGVHFAIVSRHATRVWLALFDARDSNGPMAEFELTAAAHRLGDIWSIHIAGLKAGVYYAYRMDGPCSSKGGHCYEGDLFILDPYARAVTPITQPPYPKAVVTETNAASPPPPRPRVPLNKSVIYEMHVRGFTKHPSSRVAAPGTYHGIIEKIPYLQELGVTAVELLPVPECGETGVGRVEPESGGALTNYWGYNPISFFVPTRRFTVSDEIDSARREFREMVEALHHANIEVILDVVFNHTSEKGDGVRAISFRLIDNSLYYILNGDGNYQDLTGCHNTLNCSHPIVQELIVDCLRYWVTEFGVDGFRFDLASVFYRGTDGQLLERSPIVERISHDPVLRETKLIAEPWDCAGGYHVGNFGGTRWSEWNDKFRDTVRRFWGNEPFAKNDFVQRFSGSPDIYLHVGRSPLNSINYVTCHDGFTLRDLVSYERKHNEANGEGNRDGTDANYSHNCGVEGETEDAAIKALRLKLQKNHLATLFLSIGVPMLLGGDEFGRTQQGNNNAYCQDNEISWFDWTLLETNRELHRFCRKAIRFRKDNPVFTRDMFFPPSSSTATGHPGLLWLDERHRPQTWSTEPGILAGHVEASENGGVALYMMFNATPNVIDFRLPLGDWRVRINTAEPSPSDFHNPDTAPPVPADRAFRVAGRSLVVLTAQA